jgi:sec-independent protein translocase protein TatA
MVTSSILGASTLAFIGSLGPTEMLIIAGVAVLLFGSRLPEVARSMGKSVVEFKKGMNGIESEVSSAIHSSNSTAKKTPSYTDDDVDREIATAPKFEPPTSEPQAS